MPVHLQIVTFPVRVQVKLGFSAGATVVTGAGATGSAEVTGAGATGSTQVTGAGATGATGVTSSGATIGAGGIGLIRAAAVGATSNLTV